MQDRPSPRAVHLYDERWKQCSRSPYLYGYVTETGGNIAKTINVAACKSRVSIEAIVGSVLSVFVFHSVAGG